MIILDSPYVSKMLKDTIVINNIPALCSGDSTTLGLKDIDLLSTQDAIREIETGGHPRIYTNSENSINWITEHLSFTELPDRINLFKNKVLFRKTLREMYPDFLYKEIHHRHLRKFNISLFSAPFILKPAVGFFSMGVYRISSQKEWNHAIDDIEKNFQKLRGIYPDSVFDSTTFIAEEVIEGDEYAIDAYYNSEGKPVIMNIMKHLFASEKDVSDRVYITSDEIISDNLNSFTSFLENMGKLTGIKNFPCHAELRIRENGEIIPVEINPMRFGGWCTTGDLALMAWDFNPYLYYLHDRKPDWGQILKGKDKDLYSIIVLDNSTGIEGMNITSFDYDSLRKNFNNPLELRKIDYREYPVFGFLFTRTDKKKDGELKRILSSNLREYILE